MQKTTKQTAQRKYDDIKRDCDFLVRKGFRTTIINSALAYKYYSSERAIQDNVRRGEKSDKPLNKYQKNELVKLAMHYAEIDREAKEIL